MLNLYFHKGAIDVTLKNGQKEKLTPMQVYLLSILIAEKKINIEKAISYFKQDLEPLSAYAFALLVNKGLDTEKALNFVNEEKLPYLDKTIIMHGLRRYGSGIETFIDEDYKFLKVSNETVIDIGANVGDTPIYFALKGAKKVIALEPDFNYFTIANLNIEENNLNSK
ncbi:MAG: FkbM family methyltransferase, partial [Nitrososphaeria archaeon]